MPPKNKGKKGKKGGDDDDAYWAAKEAEFEAKHAATPVEDEAAGGGAFDALDDDMDGGGGLMAAIAAAKNKKKDKKKKKATFADLDPEDEEGAEPVSKEAERVNMDDEWPEEDVKPKKGKKDKKKKKAAAHDDEDDLAAAEEPAPAADDFADKAPQKASLEDEWPEDDVKPKKGKKGKKGKQQKVEDDLDEDDLLAAAAAEAAAARAKAEEEAKAKAEAEKAAAAAAAPAEDDDEEETGGRILTKKEKEKLKKEKEKAKKKAQAAKKKAAATEEPAEAAEPAASPAAEPEAAPAAEDEDEGEETAAASSKNKKKKKKPAAKAEPAPAKPKKVAAHILALQAAMEEKKRLEEEAQRAAEEERRRREEEEARIAEEERLAEEAKAAKKEKERLKREKAKAEGRLLTPAQKRERAAAEARKQALLASGVTVAALQGGGAAAKRPVYNKKKGGKGPQAQTPSEPSTRAASPAPKEDKKEEPKEEDKKEEPKEEPKKEEPKKEESDDDWDKSDTEVAAATAAVKDLKVKEESDDDWDKSDGEEDKPAPKAAPAKAAPAKAAPAKAEAPKAAPAKPAAAASNGKPAAKAPAKAESESEDESDEDSDEDSDDSDDSDEDSDEDSDDSSDDEIEAAKERARVAIAARRKAAEAAQTKSDLRSPICCILGHVDTGKTKLLDKIRQTSVQEGEAGGITQQIGATFFPKEALIEKTQVVNKDGSVDVKIPGLLIIDTPGHESFTNLRSRGSSLCNIAILVIDITHGLEPQTIESLNLLKMRKTPFIVALNKIDKLDATEWKVNPDMGFRDTLATQSKRMQRMFEDRLNYIKGILMEQGLNSEVYDRNTQPGRVVSIVPTSAVTGEGVPDLLALLVKLTQERMTGSLMYLSEAEATILEVKVIEGLGTTIDIVLVNGVLREGDKIVLCGMNGPIVTNIRALLTPQPMRELRIKSAYVHHKEVKAALGVKISAPGLEKAIAGARMFVARNSDEEEYYKDLAMDDLTSLDKFIQKTGRGVFVQASTLGSLEALLVFLKDMNIPVFEFGLGPVYKSAVIRAGLMLDRAPEYAVMLCFDVPVTFEAEEQAKRDGVKIFSAMIIYHLFDAFKKHMEEVKEARQKEAAPMAVWPCKLKILKVFASKDPIIVGCDIVDGTTCRVGTPVGVVRYDKEKGTREIIPLGKITGLEINHKPQQIVKRHQVGAGVAVKIERAAHQAARSFGRHFDEKDEIVSLISRKSLDTLKSTFRDQVEMSDWALLKVMKQQQGIA